MFCPQCGATQTEDLKFCNACGAHLLAVRQALTGRPLAPPATGEKFDWSKTWVAEMFLSEGERKRRVEEMEQLRGITPEVKRYQEVKAGVITSSIGVAVAIFLFFLMQGIIAGGNATPEAAAVLSRIWIAGVIPFLVGVGLIINGTVVGKRIAEATRRSAQQPTTGALEGGERYALRPPDTGEIVTPPSVTEGTTRHLETNDRTR